MLGLLVLADARALEPSTERAELVELIAVQSASNLRTAAAVAELRHRASTDPLTGLGHRGAFGEALGASHRRPIATAVALCDIDNFKALNDRFGHQEGDRALVAVVQALDGALRRGDLLFRLGGDEFAALLAVRNERGGPRGGPAHARRRRGLRRGRDGVGRRRGLGPGRAGRLARRPRGPGALRGQAPADATRWRWTTSAPTSRPPLRARAVLTGRRRRASYPV